MSTSDVLRWEQMSVGDELGPLDYVVSAEVAHEFFEGSMIDPVVVDRLGAIDGGVAHPLQTLTDYLWLIQERYAPMGTGLHASHETRCLRPIPLDQSLVATGRILDLYTRRDRDYWVAAYEISDADGVLVEHVMKAAVDREAGTAPASAEQKAGAAPGRTPRSAEEPATWSSFARHEFSLPMQRAYDRQYWLRRGADFATTPNAHTSVEVARGAGLPDAVAHSSHYYCWFADAALLEFGTEWMSDGTLSARFLAPVYPGETVVIEGGRAGDELRLRAVDAAGRPVAVGTALSCSRD